MSCGDSFAYQFKYFSKSFNVYAPDLTGFGKNGYMPYPYSLGDYVTEVHNYIEQNGLKKPHVIAHSFGARIVLKTLYGDPSAFDKVVLTGAAGLKPRYSFKKGFKKAAFNLLKTFFPREKLSGFYSKDYIGLSPVMKASFRKIVAETLDYTLGSIKNPVLLVFGKNDTETPLYMAKRFEKELANAKLTVLSDAGHFAFVDRPLTFNREVEKFLLS